MGHFRWSSYAYLLFKNGNILTTITSTTSIHKGKATTATISAKKTSTLFLPVTYKRKGISTSRRARELIQGSNWGRIQFPIHWCRLQVWPHQGRTLTVGRSPLSALVTKLAFQLAQDGSPQWGWGGSADVDIFQFYNIIIKCQMWIRVEGGALWAAILC